MRLSKGAGGYGDSASRREEREMEVINGRAINDSVLRGRRDGRPREGVQEFAQVRGRVGKDEKGGRGSDWDTQEYW